MFSARVPQGVLRLWPPASVTPDFWFSYGSWEGGQLDRQTAIILPVKTRTEEQRPFVLLSREMIWGTRVSDFITGIFLKVN